MKRIVSEDHATKDQGGGRAISQAAPYSPSYSGVNQIVAEAPGAAFIAFNDAMGRESRAKLNMHIKLLSDTERDQRINAVNSQHRGAVEGFKEQNPSGVGLMEFSTKTYRDLMNKAAEDCASKDASAQIRAYSDHGFKSVANTAFRDEQTMRTAYGMATVGAGLEVKLNQIQSDPDNYVKYRDEGDALMDSASNLFPNAEYIKQKRVWDQNALEAYGTGLIEQNPSAGKDSINNREFLKLEHKRYSKLARVAEQRRNEEAKRRHHEELTVQAKAKSDSALRRKQLISGFKLGNLHLSDAIAANAAGDLSNDDLKVCEIAYNEHNQKEDEYLRHKDLIVNALQGNGNMHRVPEESQKRFFKEESIAAQERINAERASSGLDPRKLTFQEKGMIAQGLTFKNRIILGDMQETMRHSRDSQDVVSSCVEMIRMQTAGPNSMGEVDVKFTNFANEVAGREMLPGTDMQEIIKRARERYLGYAEHEKGVRSKVYTKVMSEQASTYDKMKSKSDFFHPWTSGNLIIRDENQLAADFSFEVQNAIDGGARNSDEIREIAIANVEKRYRKVGKEAVRMPPELIMPHLSIHAVRNRVAYATQKLLTNLNGDFKPHGQMIKPFTTEVEYNTRQLTTTEYPIVEYTHAGKKYTGTLKYEADPHVRGVYTMYVNPNPNNLRYRKYVPAKGGNPFTRAFIRLGGS